MIKALTPSRASCKPVRPPALEPLVLRFYREGFLNARIEVEPDDARAHRKVRLTKKGKKRKR